MVLVSFIVHHLPGTPIVFCVLFVVHPCIDQSWCVKTGRLTFTHSDFAKLYWQTSSCRWFETLILTFSRIHPHLRLKIIARIPMAFNRPTKFVRVDEGKIWPENLSQNVPYWLVSPPIGVIPTGWWFGTWLYAFPFSWECHYPNWRSHILQRNRPTTNQICISVYPSNQRQ